MTEKHAERPLRRVNSVSESKTILARNVVIVLGWTIKKLVSRSQEPQSLNI